MDYSSEFSTAVLETEISCSIATGTLRDDNDELEIFVGGLLPFGDPGVTGLCRRSLKDDANASVLRRGGVER